MSAWLSLSFLADIVLIVMAIEAGVLLWRHRRHGDSLPPAVVLRILLPGAFLVLAMRFGAGLPDTLLPLVLALAAAFSSHLVDLHHRRRGS
jgi:hypothetical protein